MDDHQHIELVREVCQSFREKVEPKLHLLPKQIIHGDANYNNILLTPNSNELIHDFGFIDFADIDHSCRVFDIAISLMHIFNVTQDLCCGRSQMAEHFFAGYHSVNPLSNDEIELLPVLIASRFCQSLVFGAFTYKHIDPGNNYIIRTSRNGWKNFHAFWKLPREEMLKIFPRMERPA